MPLNGKAKKARRRRTVFVGNLPYDTSLDAIRTLLESCGPIQEARMVGEGGNCALVIFATPDSAESALENKNGSEYEGRVLRVERYATPGEGLTGVADQTSLFVGNLPVSTTDDDIRRRFAFFGRVLSVRWLPNTDGKVVGSALLQMDSPQAVEKAVARSGNFAVGGRNVRIDYSKDKSTRSLQLGDSRRLKKVNKVLVGNLADGTTEEEIRRIMAKCGAVKLCSLLDALDGRKCRQVLVVFASPAAVPAALQLVGHKVKGREIHVMELEDPQKKEDPPQSEGDGKHVDNSKKKKKKRVEETDTSAEQPPKKKQKKDVSNKITH